MMQGPPRDLTMPRHGDEDPITPPVLKLILLAVFVTLGTFLLLNAMQNHAESRAQDRWADCVLSKTSIQSAADPCVKVVDVPWYATHPAAAAIGLGIAVLVLGRVALFMARMERSRGR
jgi:hypothetical protein